MTYSNTSALRERRETPTGGASRFISACVVAGVHIACIAWLAGRVVSARGPKVAAVPMVAEIITLVRSDTPWAGVQLIPVDQPLQLDTPELPIAAAPDPAVDAPRIDPALAIDVAPYSARAELTPGIIATILLLLEISPEGSVLSAQIVRSNAGDAANAAAIQYAHATHWMPGKVGGEPRAMQASLTVILGERS
jgi:hypothetical protein